MSTSGEIVWRATYQNRAGASRGRHCCVTGRRDRSLSVRDLVADAPVSGPAGTTLDRLRDEGSLGRRRPERPLLGVASGGRRTCGTYAESLGASCRELVEELPGRSRAAASWPDSPDNLGEHGR
jgi:hypothetical protein